MTFKWDIVLKFLHSSRSPVLWIGSVFSMFYSSGNIFGDHISSIINYISLRNCAFAYFISSSSILCSLTVYLFWSVSDLYLYFHFCVGLSVSSLSTLSDPFLLSLSASFCGINLFHNINLLIELLHILVLATFTMFSKFSVIQLFFFF